MAAQQAQELAASQAAAAEAAAARQAAAEAAAAAAEQAELKAKATLILTQLQPPVRLLSGLSGLLLLLKTVGLTGWGLGRMRACYWVCLTGTTSSSSRQAADLTTDRD